MSGTIPPPASAGIRIPDDLWLGLEGSIAFVESIARQLDPYQALPGNGDAPALVMRETQHRPRLIELQHLAGDGWVTGHDGERLYVVANGRTCSVPLDDGLLVAEPGFPTRRLMSIVRPALQDALLERGTPVLHAACVDVGGRAVLVAGWSESGKTETALALVERGGSFLSDKWTLLLPGARAGAFPVGVGIRRWVLEYLPRLRAGLPGKARAQLRLAAVVSGATAPIRSRTFRGPFGLVAEVTRRAVELGDRAGLSPAEVRAAYGDTQDPLRKPTIGMVAVLRNGTDRTVSVEQGDPERLAMRLAISAATEREPFTALRRRAAYALGVSAGTDDIVARDAVAIEATLRAVPVVEITSPFPTDPRVAAGEILARL